MNYKLHIKRIAILTICLLLGGSQTAFAFDEQFYSDNDILFYNPDATNCSAATGATSLVGSNGIEKAFNYFIGKGLTAQQSAGVVGNLQGESGVVPAKIQGGAIAPDTVDIMKLTYPSGAQRGFGIAQWTSPNRKEGLVSFSKTTGLKITDLGLQLDYVWKEFNGPYKSSTLTPLKATSSIRDATNVVLLRYESPKAPNLSARAALANIIYGKYSSKTDTGPTEQVDPVGSTPADLTDTTTAPDAGCAATQTGDIVSLARAELAKGAIEKPIGCDHANSSAVGDCGADVNKYTDKHLEYWCADFVSWLYKQAGKPFTGGSSGGWRYPGVSNLADWFKKNGVYTANGPSATPKPGDVYFIAGYEHAGIVDHVDGKTLYTISGNTSVDSTNNGRGVGDGVYMNFQSNSRIIGFGALK